MTGARRPLRSARTWLPVLALATVAALSGLAGCSNPAASPVTEAPVTRALAIPALEEGVVAGDVRTYSLDVQSGTTDFGVGAPPPPTA